MTTTRLLSLLAFAGCATDPVDGGLDPGKSDVSTLPVTWRIASFERTEIIGCASHGLTVATVSWSPLDKPDEVNVQKVDCEAGFVALEVPQGDIFVSIEFENADGFWSATPGRFLSIGGEGPQRVDETVFEDAGYLFLPWKLVGAESGRTMFCEQMPDFERFSLVMSNGGPVGGFGSTYSCDEAPFGPRDVVGPIAAGDWTVSIEAFDNILRKIGAAEPFTVTIEAPNVTTLVSTKRIVVGGN
jgi:hypothetical protein